MFKKLLAPVLVGMMLLMTGCELFNPIGPIIQLGVMWIEGEAQKYYNVDQQTLIRATKDTLKELEFPIQKEEEDGSVYYITAGDEGSDRFKIKVTAVRHNVAKLSIRVNIMGDRPYAEMIYRHVDKQPGVIQFTSLAELNEAVTKPDRKKQRHRD